MEVIAKVKNLGLSVKKTRLVADMVRGMDLKKAKSQLRYANKKAGRMLKVLLEQGASNAKNNFGLNLDNLYISEIKVDGGQALHRWMPRAHGRAFPILRRSCHISLILKERVIGLKREKVKTEKAKFVSYAEVKKTLEQADKILNNKEKSKKKDIVKSKDSKISGSKFKDKDSRGNIISRIFRRKSM